MNMNMNQNTIQTALVTGTSSGIGLSIARALLAQNIRVYGISRTPAPIADANYHEQLLDLTDFTALEGLMKSFADCRIHFDLLVNNAGCGFYGLHENIACPAIADMVATNLTAPLLLTNHVLRHMKEQGHGTIVNISSYTAGQVNPHGAAYGATKAALSSFSESIFAESRKHGVRVILMEPELTMTNLYRNADFEASGQPLAHLDPEEIASLLVTALSNEIGYQRLTFEPQYHQIIRKKN